MVSDDIRHISISVKLEDARTSAEYLLRMVEPERKEIKIMRKLEFQERDSLLQLFKNPTSGVIHAALYKDISEMWKGDTVTDQNGLIFVENTFYYGGQSIDEEGLDFLMKQISMKKLPKSHIIPQDRRAISSFDELLNQGKYKNIVKKSERHLMDINMNSLNYKQLNRYIKELPEKYQIKPIDERLFKMAGDDSQLIDFIKLFKDYDDFCEDGLGYFVVKDNEIIGGVSSYARYKDGVEVQIAVNTEYRGQHLARSLGAQFILECDKRKLYPWWDCANPVSEHIAIKLGYVLKQITVIYKCVLL